MYLIKSLRSALPLLSLAAILLGQPGPGVAQSTTTTEVQRAALDATYMAEMKQSMEEMHHTMSADMLTGDPDKDFLIMMIPHHQGAVDMARIQLKYGKNPELKKMARQIIDSQEVEIKEMDNHLKQFDVHTTAPSTQPASTHHAH